MKNSGIEWIGEIPNDWELIKIGSIFRCRNEKVNDTDYPPLSVTRNGIVPQMDNVAKTDANDNRKMVKVNDFVINSRSDRKQSCGVSEFEGSVSLINTVLYTDNQDMILPEYTNLIMKNYGFAEEFYRWGHGIVADLWTTRWQEMKSIVIPLPNIQQQKRIVEFVQKKVSTIDRLIAHVEATIEELKVYKQSVITEAVTKGLNKSASMKDSGIEWVGQIPSGWDVRKLKNVCEVFGRIGFRGYRQEDMVDEGEGAITLSPSNMKDMKMNYEKCSFLTWDKYFESPEIQIKRGDILFVKTGSTFGKVAFVETLPMEATINPQIIVIRNFKIYNKYLCYFLCTPLTRAQIDCSVVGGTIPTISQEKILNYRIFIPPLEEQRKIADHLDMICTDIDSIISIKQQKIDELKEYKKSLIYEYVTGKKEIA
ncbi:MAG: restriction endonuclease subunit S [Clostridiales bacterium]|nr:restriction endonuclease subunit S [Clostridiales bacterium]